MAAADPDTAFRPIPSPKVLSRVVCLKEERRASNGSTISFSGSTYRLFDQWGKGVLLYPRSKVIVLTRLDGSISALYQDKPYSLEAFCQQPKVSEKQTPAAQKQVKSAQPAKNNPWRNFKFGKTFNRSGGAILSNTKVPIQQ